MYNRDAYTGDDPLWLRRNSHYFRNLEPDRKMLQVVDNINASLRYTGDEIFILTSLINNNMSIFNEHVHDKIVSFNKWFPYIDIDHILIAGSSKRDTVAYITDVDVNRSDILIDDYNQNLIAWRSFGGTAIKYSNGINDPRSFDGHSVGLMTSCASAEDITDYLLKFKTA